MKKIIFFVLALMVLVGIGVGGFIMFGQHKEATAGAEHKEPPAKKKPEGPPQFATIGPIVVPVMGETRVEQTVMFMVALEVPDDNAKDRVRSLTPRLLDAYLGALYGKIGKNDVSEGQLVDVANIKERLTEATVKVLGPDVVDNVLIQSVTQRPIF
jgi:flagellar FliL protein